MLHMYPEQVSLLLNCYLLSAPVRAKISQSLMPGIIFQLVARQWTGTATIPLETARFYFPSIETGGSLLWVVSCSKWPTNIKCTGHSSNGHSLNLAARKLTVTSADIIIGIPPQWFIARGAIWLTSDRCNKAPYKYKGFHVYGRLLTVMKIRHFYTPAKVGNYPLHDYISVCTVFGFHLKLCSW